MDRKTALALFESLESERVTEVEGDPPTYVVRLDAGYLPGADRFYRVRVTPGELGLDRDGWLFVLEQAGEFEVSVDIQNSGIELT